MSNRKKQLKEQYKQRKVVGAVCRVLNLENGRYYLQSTDNLQGSINSFAFAQSTNYCPLPPIRRDWDTYGSGIFSFEVLEELEKKEEQSAEEFRQDLKTLQEMWKEQLDSALSY